MGARETKVNIPENVLAFMEVAANDAGRIAAESFSQSLYTEIIEGGVSSPIEQMFLIALNVVAQANFIDINPAYEFGGEPYLALPGVGIYVFPQHKVGQYRVDFLLSSRHSDGDRIVVVELDGHNFHDKNKAQRSYEKARDRFLQRNGYKVLHFTGSDVCSDPYFVAYEVICSLETHLDLGEYNKSNPLGID